MPQEWADALAQARKILEATEAAPVWLAQALAAAETVAPALAPVAAQEDIATDYFYPH